MKKLIIAAVICIYFLTVSAFGQGKPAVAANNHPNTNRPSSTPPTTPAANDTRSRVMAATQPAANTQATSSAVWGNAPLISNTERPRMVVNTPAPSSSPVVPPVTPAATTIATPVAAVASAPTETYRVGVGDILDIQIQDSMSDRSTLYTVLEGGILDYPLAQGTVSVEGLTTDAIAARLSSSIKVLNNPPVTVKVRDFASHTVNVIGFVGLPGTKVLRREAVPLYVVMSQSMPLAEANSATVERGGKSVFVANLKDSNALNQLVQDGDLIRVSGTVVTASAPEYFYGGGEVNAPGQKTFTAGLTLTQAIIVSGGTSRNAGNIVRVSRQNADGRLVSTEYNLNNIRNGKTPDPLVQKGDRIEVHSN